MYLVEIQTAINVNTCKRCAQKRCSRAERCEGHGDCSGEEHGVIRGERAEDNGAIDGLARKREDHGVGAKRTTGGASAERTRGRARRRQRTG